MRIRRQRSSLLALAASALMIGPMLVAGPASADQVPPGWGEPVQRAAFMTVVGRQDGHLRHHRGNQHVAVAATNDEDTIVGALNDWRCPRGVTAPVYNGEETACKNVGSNFVVFDYDAYAAGAPTAIRWSSGLKHLRLRAPALVQDATTGATVRHGNVTIRVRAHGAKTLHVYDNGDGSGQTFLVRKGAHVIGGTFFGSAWRDMTSVEVSFDNPGEIALFSYYDPIPQPE